MITDMRHYYIVCEFRSIYPEFRKRIISFPTTLENKIHKRRMHLDVLTKKIKINSLLLTLYTVESTLYSNIRCCTNTIILTNLLLFVPHLLTSNSKILSFSLFRKP